MADSTSKYWEKRAREREAHWTDKCQREIEQEMARYYAAALREIEKDILALYARFAQDNALSMKDTRNLLHGQEFRDWRMGMKDYLAEIKRLKDAGQISESQGLLRELNTLAMRSRITVLDKLRSETLRELDSLGRKTETAMGKFLGDAYKDAYYRSVFDIGKEGMFRGSFSKVDSKQVENVLRTPWSGKNYSERIWNDMKKLEGTIQDMVTQGIHRGLSIQKMTQKVMERMNVSRSNAERLVRTEMNYAQNQAALEGIKDAGMGFFRFVAVLDSRTTPICRGHDGEVFPVEEASPGSNVPPLHPRCRSTIIASLDDDSSGKRPKGTRIARDSEGRNIRVPRDMRYEDWKRVHIDRTMNNREFSLKMNEEAAYKAKTDKNFGFRRKKQTDMLWGEELKLVNPNYNLKVGVAPSEYTSNCQRCVAAYEARMRGFDVESMPYWGKLDNMDKPKNWLSVFDYKVSDIIHIPGNSDAARHMVADIMKKFGPGSRAIVRVGWNEKSGHVFIAEQSESGITRFLDPQSGETAVGPKHFDLSVAGGTFIIRVDNLPFTDKVKKCCRNKPQRKEVK